MDLPPDGQIDQLESFVMRDMLLRLFFTRTGNTVVEVAAEGYAPITLRYMDWIIDGRVATAKNKLFTFAKSFRTPIQGYYCTRPGSDKVIYLEDFDEPYEVKRAGDGAQVTAKFTL